MRTPRMARHLPSKLQFFHHASSLAGVERLIEWRAIVDEAADERVSVGCEEWQDLQWDLERALKEVQSLE